MDLAALGDKMGGDAARGGARGTSAELIDRVEDLIENKLDQYIEHYAESDPEFYSSYWTARAIPHHGVRHRKEEEAAAEQKK